MAKSETPDEALSDYQLFSRYAILHGLTMTNAAKIWNESISCQYSDRNAMLDMLFSHLNKQGSFYDIEKEEDDRFRNYVAVEGVEIRSEIVNRKRDRAVVRRRLNVDGYTCQNCRFPETIEKEGLENAILVEVHHKNMIQDGERETQIDDLITLCPNCHRLIHVIGKRENRTFLDLELLERFR